MVEDSTSIFWESVHKTSRSWVDVLIFYILLFVVVYVTETLTMIRQAFGDESMSHTQVFE
jgi:hypothetical protein